MPIPISVDPSTSEPELEEFQEWIRFDRQRTDFLSEFASFMDEYVRECRPLGLKGFFLYGASNDNSYFSCTIWSDKSSYQAVFGRERDPATDLGQQISDRLEALARGRLLRLGASELWRSEPGMVIRRWPPIGREAPH